MAYDSVHNITQKLQGHQKVTPGGATVPFKKTSYANSYAYTGSQPHAPTKIGDFAYSYDKNGNQTGWDDLTSGQKRAIVWDEENRIQEIHDNGHTSEFKYNDAGERVIKRGEQGETAYVNQFWTIRNKSVGTKHVFVGETRIASKVVPGSANVDPGDLFGSTLGPWAKQPSQGKKTVQNPHYAGNKMPANLAEDNFVFFYHPDHLGSTEFVTEAVGELYEHVQYFPFGETWVSEHKNTEKLPYLFSSKELDEDTGLYYFGMRYYDPRTSVWQSADPMLEAFLEPPHDEGGISIPQNLALYSYAWQSPIVLYDPTGGQVVPPAPGRPSSPEEAARRDNARAAEAARPKTQFEKWKARAEAAAIAAGVVVVVVAAAHPKTRQMARQLAPKSGRLLEATTQAGKELIADRTGSLKIKLHHIATNKNWISELRGGPWSPRFAALFKKGGMTLKDAANLVGVRGHHGPHPEAYHQAVFDRLSKATRGLRGKAFGAALRDELKQIAKESRTKGAALNRMLTE